MSFFIRAVSCQAIKKLARPSMKIDIWKTNYRQAHNFPNTYDFARERIMLVLRCFDKIDPYKITLDSHFYEDLGLDSLDHVEIIMELEDEFNYEIPDKDAEKLLRPRDILRYITDKDEAYEELQRLEIEDHHYHAHDEHHQPEPNHNASAKIDLNFVKRHFSTTASRLDDIEKPEPGFWQSGLGKEGQDKVETSFLKDLKPDKISLEEYQERVLKVCKKYDKIDSSKLNLSSHFFEDLGLDSLDHVEIIMELEDEFSCTIPDQDAEKLFRPGDIVKYLLERQEDTLKTKKTYEDRF